MNNQNLIIFSILSIFTLNSSGFTVSSGLLINKYLHVSGTLGSILANKFSRSFSNTMACYLNLFLVPFRVREKFYVLTILIEHKSSSNFVASCIKLGTSLNLIELKS